MSVEETIFSRKYIKLKKNVFENYSEYLDYPLGNFLLLLKERGDLLYLCFLNPFGDRIYSKFGVNRNITDKGIYLFTFGSDIIYLGRSHDPFYKRLNFGYGNISPKNCYLDGQSTNCRINSLITKYWSSINLYIYPISNDWEINNLERELIVKHQPEWNIISYKS